jgi:hypothetical protein
MRVFAFAFLLLSAGLARADGPAIDGPAEVKPGGFARLTAGGGLPVLWHVEPEPVQADDGRPGEVTFTGVPGTEYKVTADVFDFKAGAATRIRKTVKFLPFAGLQMRPAMALPPAAPPASPPGGVPQAKAAPPPADPTPAVREGREAMTELAEKLAPAKASAAAPFAHRPASPTTPATTAPIAATPRPPVRGPGSSGGTPLTGSTFISARVVASPGSTDANCTAGG